MNSSVSARQNADLMEAKYAQWCEAPNLVEPTWAAFFEGFELGSAQLKRKEEAAAGVTAGDMDTAFYGRVTSLIYNYRTLGHTQAHINPLEQSPERNPRLNLDQFGLKESDLDREVSNSFFRHGDQMKLRDMVAGLEATYSGKIGFEFMHINNTTVRHWVRERIEMHALRDEATHEKRLNSLCWVLEAEAFENFIGKRHFVRPVHFWFYNINAGRARIADRAGAAQIVHRDQNADRRVHQAFGNFSAGAVERSVGIHVMADVADQHQAATMQAQLPAGGRAVNAIRPQPTLDDAIAFGEARRQRAVHQAKPIAINEDLVLRINGGNGIFHVDDGGDCSFNHQIGDARRISFADGMRAINYDLKMQSVVDQQHGFGRAGVSGVACKLRRRLQTCARAVFQRDDERAACNAIACGIGMRANRQRRS